MKQILKRWHHKYIKHPRAFYVIGALLLIGMLMSLWLFFSLSYKNQLPVESTLPEDQLFPVQAENAHKNLDLRIAKQGNFDSEPIQKIDTLGNTDGINRYLFKYQVKEDSLTEYGLITQPATKQPAGGYPVIILCHGYVNPKRYSTEKAYLPDMLTYSKAGFVVIKPDFRGQGWSKKVGRPEGAYYSMAYNTDLLSLITAVKKTPYLDSKNINLWGFSMGSYLALRAAVMSSDIKNLILVSGPIANFDDMYYGFFPTSDKNNPTALAMRQAVLLRYGPPTKGSDFWDHVSPSAYLGDLKAKVQIYVGGSDTVVPPKFSAEFNSQLNTLKKPHSYTVFPDAGHGLVKQRPVIYTNTLRLLRTGSP